jgi:1,2-phenylacetyl-CoA epoxidase PaaB subunit
MAKKPTQKKLIQWEVYRLKGSPASVVGIVYAPDEKAALKAAIKEFRLLIRPAALVGRALT